ncbi:MAG: hypothetical protein JW929_02470 [Anaerolineales bacterium]|nr:hypothetical protein [Anaerolineales bacterium]
MAALSPSAVCSNYIIQGFSSHSGGEGLPFLKFLYLRSLYMLVKKSITGVLGFFLHPGARPRGAGGARSRDLVIFNNSTDAA